MRGVLVSAEAREDDVVVLVTDVAVDDTCGTMDATVTDDLVEVATADLLDDSVTALEVEGMVDAETAVEVTTTPDEAAADLPDRLDAIKADDADMLLDAGEIVGATPTLKDERLKSVQLLQLTLVDRGEQPSQTAHFLDHRRE
jgi:hypothetical protein